MSGKEERKGINGAFGAGVLLRAGGGTVYVLPIA